MMPKKTIFLMLCALLLALTACNLDSAPGDVKAEGDASAGATLEVDPDKVDDSEATPEIAAESQGVAVADANPDTSNLQSTPEPPAPLNTAVPPTATIIPTETTTPTTAPTATLDPTISAMLVRPIDTTLLVWTADGAAPGLNQTANPGQAAFVDSEGIKSGMDLPAPTSTVLACGGPQAAVSADGRYYAFYSGTDIGALYLMIDEQPPSRVTDNLSLLTCLGGGTFQFSGDSSRFAYIAYDADATRGEFARGVLRVHASADPAEVETFDNVAAFDMQFGQLAYATFFTNDRNEVDEVAVTVWDGTAGRELATINPDPDSVDCRFTSASLDFAPSGDLG
ncbi:MAG: hypothetical protein H7175_28435, partial [Burkholderiales bacterium]|nr:hypothetical protein [Anaerolineae bacterium]